MRCEGIWYDVNTKKPEQRPRKWVQQMWGWAKEHENGSRNRSNALEIMGMDWKTQGGTRRRRNSLVNMAWGVPNIVSILRLQETGRNRGN